MWILGAALCLAGCSSNEEPDSTALPASTASHAAQLQSIATSTPAPPLPPPPPPPTDVPAEGPAEVPAGSSSPPAVQPLPTSITAEQQRAGDEARRGQVARLRAEMRALESRKGRAQARWDQLKAERLEREKQSGVSNAPGGAESLARDEVSSCDNEISARQRQIDDLMMSR